jgi:tetratricopeptide (TPR) repeat protein
MLHAVTGNDALAQKRLEDAGRLTATPPWRLAREKGRLAYLRGSFSEAVKELNEASRLRPDDLDARLLLMDAYYAAGDTEGMNRVKIEVLRRFEDRPESKLAGGRFDLVLGKINSAITQLDDALSRLQARPAPPRVLAEVYTLLGHAFLDNGKLFKAEAYLQQAIKLDPSSAEAHYWMGMVHLDHGYYLKAKAEFETALGLRPNYAQAWYDLGETSRRQKDKKAAERAYRKYLELAPDGTFSSEVRDYLR